jgi:Leucine-rich repeat (LRR) protein
MYAVTGVIPSLPNTIETIECASNYSITGFTSLPSSLKKLYCDGNIITNLPPFPSTLEYLSCESNIISTLPPIPNSLKE